MTSASARRPARDPSRAALADFATALARQVWNEPNLSIQLMPQFVNGKPASPEWYRAMVNAMAAATHGVHRDDVVIAGGLARSEGKATIRPAATCPTRSGSALAPELHARWVSEALYLMCKEGVRHVTRSLLRDEPFPDNMLQ